jgi:hypothetical protein
LLAGENPAAILVHHEAPDGATTGAQPNRDIRIVGNDIATCAAAGIDVKAATDVTIHKNTLADLNRLQYAGAGYGVLLSNVDDTEVTENTVSGRADALSGFGLGMNTGEVVAADNEVTIDGETRSGTLKTLVPVSLAFSRTVQVPEGGRPLAFLCYELWLEDDSGSVIYHASLGSDETGMRIGNGVDSKEQTDGESWRWFGPADNRSVLYFFASDLSKATTLRVRGHPIESDISAAVRVDGTITDEITWRSTTTDEFTLSLTE